MSNDIEDEVILLMQGWANRPRDYWQVEGKSVSTWSPGSRCFASDGLDAQFMVQSCLPIGPQRCSMRTAGEKQFKIESMVIHVNPGG